MPTPGADYIPTSNTLVFCPGVTTNLFLVPLLNNPNMLSDQTVDLELSNSMGGFLATPSPATLTIATVYAGPGMVSFAQPSYTVSEGRGLPRDHQHHSHQRSDRQHFRHSFHQQRHRHRRE